MVDKDPGKQAPEPANWEVVLERCPHMDQNGVARHSEWLAIHLRDGRLNKSARPIWREEETAISENRLRWRLNRSMWQDAVAEGRFDAVPTHVSLAVEEVLNSALYIGNMTGARVDILDGQYDVSDLLATSFRNRMKSTSNSMHDKWHAEARIARTLRLAQSPQRSR